MRIHRSTLVAIKAVVGFEKVADGSAEGDTAQPHADKGDGSGMHWAVVIRGIPEKLAVSRRQQHLVKEF